MNRLSQNDGFDDVETTLIARNSATAASGFSLRIVAGQGIGETLVVDGATSTPALVGTSPFASLVLNDPAVSRRHLSAVLSGEFLRVVDLGSKNGTRVNGVRVKEVWLTGGERVFLGGTLLEVERTVEDAPLLPATNRFGRLLGRSVAMRRLYPLCSRLAATDVPVVIEGETGTGKEVLAEALHEQSRRASGPFVVFDCTAVPASLLEAALFGHERGAFTGATDSRPGVFEEADGGTLLIDEIGDLDIGLQATLLRAIERGEVRRIGGKKWTRVDVRVLAATRRDLDALVAAGRFRDDLYYRLGVARIELPPLRDRAGDVELLARHFWTRNDPAGELPPDFLGRLDGYAFPGNVRELANVVARRVALGELAPTSGLVRGAPSGDVIDRLLAEGLQLPELRQRLTQELEQRYVKWALERSSGNVTEAARHAGVARRYFQLIRARTVRSSNEGAR